MPGYLKDKIALVIGSGGDGHRGVAAALAEAGADVAIGGAADDLPSEAALHSIANEIWAMGHRSTVVKLSSEERGSFVEAVNQVQAELGRVDLIIQCDAVLNA
jgi:NAD(P)-dependent dehydrogenase (short-subunit alcohol dehydrogenase family)